MLCEEREKKKETKKDGQGPGTGIGIGAGVIAYARESVRRPATHSVDGLDGQDELELMSPRS
jgi:hypothetical protein